MANKNELQAKREFMKRQKRQMQGKNDGLTGNSKFGRAALKGLKMGKARKK